MMIYQTIFLSSLRVISNISVGKLKKVVKTFDKRKFPELKDFLVHKLRDFSNHDDANAACNDLINAYIEGVEMFYKSYRQS